MKKYILMGGGLLVAFALSASFTLAAKSEKAQGSHEKTTGDFTAYVGKTSLTMTLDAHGADPVKGGVSYSNSNGKNFTGVVSGCYVQDGAKSAFTGTVTGGNFPSDQKYFKVEVWDRGEGDKADGPDQIRVVLFTSMPTCSIGTSFPGIVGIGNIQVHKATEELSESQTNMITDTCTNIESGLLKTSNGDTITTGFDQWGYNYQGHMFNGTYCDAYRNAAWCQPYADVDLIMKWNDAWLSNKDCDGDGLLDRHLGYPGYIGSGAWVTNHQSGEYDGTDGEICKWNYFVKIVAVPADAVKTAGIWRAADGTEIGSAIWGEFAIIQEVSNDACADQHGVQYHSPVRAGLGNW